MNDIEFGSENLRNSIKEFVSEFIEQINNLVSSILPAISLLITHIFTEFLALLNGPYGIVLAVVFVISHSAINFLTSPQVLLLACYQNKLDFMRLVRFMGAIVSGLNSLISLVLATGLFIILTQLYIHESFQTFLLMSGIHYYWFITLVFNEVIAFSESLYIYWTMRRDYATRYKFVLSANKKLKERFLVIVTILCVIAWARFFYQLFVQKIFLRRNLQKKDNHDSAV
jgi:hypothetical protein